MAILLIIGICAVILLSAEKEKGKKPSAPRRTIRCPYCGSPAEVKGDWWECGYCGDSGKLK